MTAGILLPVKRKREGRIAMRISPPDFKPGPSVHQLVAYIADLELEVDRLRKQDQYLRHHFAREIANVRNVLDDSSLPNGQTKALEEAMNAVTAVIDDLDDSSKSHPAQDQVTAITVRPLIEQVFRWQLRLLDTPHAVLHLQLSTESINWFPIRFRHILENLLSNALKYRDSDKGESRVAVQLNHHAEALELRVSDNGLGLPTGGKMTASEYLNRSAYQRSPDVGVGLAVVKLLIEQSGGSLSVESGEGKGSNFMVSLPRYDVGDFLT
jgi:signal transduction histidine kinase